MDLDMGSRILAVQHWAVLLQYYNIGKVSVKEEVWETEAVRNSHPAERVPGSPVPWFGCS